MSVRMATCSDGEVGPAIGSRFPCRLEEKASAVTMQVRLLGALPH
jgi:hypothetical protein